MKNKLNDRYKKKTKRQIIESKKDKSVVKGEASENSVIRALRKSGKGWIINIRKSSDKENYRGIDLVLDTMYQGVEIHIPIQVKSSYKGLRNHIKKNKGKTFIPCVIVKEDTPDWWIVKAVKNARYLYIKRVVRKKP